MSKEYYYLITSLPQLRLDDYKEPYRVNEFVAEVQDHVIERHRGYVRDILCLYDNVYIIEALLGRQQPIFSRPGNWSFEDIRAAMQFADSAIDPYLTEIALRFKRMKSSQELFTRLDVEQLVATVYYEKMLRHENTFIRSYFYFDYILRNILAALNARKLQLDKPAVLDIGFDDLVEQLAVSTKNDFGLSRDLDYLPLLMEMFVKADLVNTEKFIDQIRWQTIEEMTVFNYFEIDVLLAYLIRLMLVERWIALDEHKGNEIFTARTQVNQETVARAH
jgi:Protein of unknown function (DUF2764)